MDPLQIYYELCGLKVAYGLSMVTSRLSSLRGRYD